MSSPSVRTLPLEEGAVFVYLDPRTAEAEKLRFRVDEAAVIRGDGTSVPLALEVREIGGQDTKRQRLLAYGGAPAGSYRGIALRVAEASLPSEQGVVSLTVPEEASRVDAPFDLRRGRAVVVALALRFRESLSDDRRFDPAFSATVPDKLSSSLIGLAVSRGSGTVTVFDKGTGRVAAVIPVGGRPGGLVLGAASQRAYVPLGAESAIAVIDPAEEAVVDRIQLAPGDDPVEVALTPEGETLLSVNRGSDTVSVIDPRTRSERNRIVVGSGPASILLDRAGRRAYVFNTASDSVSVVDLTGEAVVRTLATESRPIRGQFDRSGERMYVVHEASPYLTVLDPLSGTVVRRVYVGSGATTLLVDPATDRIYLPRRGAGTIDVYDPFSSLPVDSIPTGGDVAHLAIEDEGNTLCVVLPARNRLRMVRLVGHQTVAETDLGEAPCWAAFAPKR